MGATAANNAVVDPELRVFGVRGLRIADASVIPVVPGESLCSPLVIWHSCCIAKPLMSHKSGVPHMGFCIIVKPPCNMNEGAHGRTCTCVGSMGMADSNLLIAALQCAQIPATMLHVDAQAVRQEQLW